MLSLPQKHHYPPQTAFSIRYFPGIFHQLLRTSPSYPRWTTPEYSCRKSHPGYSQYFGADRSSGATSEAYTLFHLCHNTRFHCKSVQMGCVVTTHSRRSSQARDSPANGGAEKHSYCVAICAEGSGASEGCSQGSLLLP